MKNPLRSSALLFCLAALLTISAYGQGRIATVDVRKVFDGYYKKKQAEASIQDRIADYDKDFKVMTTDMDKLKTEYQKLLGEANDQILSAEEREKRKKSAEDVLRQLREADENLKSRKNQAATTLDELKKRMRENLVNEIRPVVKAKAESGGYTLVLDTSAESLNGTPVVFYYSSTGNDLTEAVLAQLNLGAPLETPKTDDHPGEKKKDEKKKDEKKK